MGMYFDHILMETETGQDVLIYGENVKPRTHDQVNFFFHFNTVKLRKKFSNGVIRCNNL
jgi:hypothetical protein